MYEDKKAKVQLYHKQAYWFEVSSFKSLSGSVG